MADTPYLSEIKIFSFNFAPRGWALCNGQLMPINQNQALFSLLGTTYGGNGQTTFALPNLQGRVPSHIGSDILLGQTGGETSHTLITNEMPAHTHPVSASGNTANATYPTDNVWANAGTAAGFHTTSDNMMSAGTITNVGGNQPHQNMPPYIVLNFCIAMQGIFPSFN
jgi:microcystin-dependent protein